MKGSSENTVCVKIFLSIYHAHVHKLFFAIHFTFTWQTMRSHFDHVPFNADPASPLFFLVLVPCSIFRDVLWDFE